MLRKGLDLSHFEDAPYDFNLLRKNGYEFMCTKATQGTHTQDAAMSAHVVGSKDAGLFTGVYHFLEPTGNSADQIKFFWNWVYPLQNKIDFVCLDFEREWKWVLVKPKKNKPGVWTKVRQSKETLFYDVTQAAEFIERNIKLPVIYYTRVSWMREFCPGLIQYFKDRPMMLAQYPYTTDLSMATEETKAEFFEKIQNYKPDHSVLSKVLVWQVSEKYQEAGMNSVTDLDIIYNELEYDKWRGQFQPPANWWDNLTTEERVLVLCKAHPELKV